MRALPDKNYKDLYTEENVIIKDTDVMLDNKWNDIKRKNTTLMVYWIQNIPKKYNKVFDEKDKPLTLNDGEIAIPRHTSEKRNIQIGDYIRIEINGDQYHYKVAHICKDVAFGSEMLGVKRYFLSDRDFDELHQKMKKENKGVLTSLTTIENCTEEDLIQQITDLDTTVVGGFNITKELVNVVYVMNMLLAGLLMIVSVTLIVIAFMILRFTILFSIQEEYKEIGIMKAIGIKNRSIRRIYIIKYLAISVIGGAFGYIVSLPMGRVLTSTIEGYLILGNNSYKLILPLIGVVTVVELIILFCYRCTKKIQKLSAMDAIRQGSNGERFNKLTRFPKLTSTKLPSWLFLGVRDLCSNFRKFTILMITFLLGTAIMIIPVNTANTLKSSNMMCMLGYAKLDTYVDVNEFDNENVEDTRKELEDSFGKIVKNTTVWAEYALTAKLSNLENTRSRQINGFKSFGKSADEYSFEDGKAPLQENEIAITFLVAKKLGVGIGDTVKARINGESYDLIVSGLFETVMNRGDGFRLSEEIIIKTPDKDSFMWCCKFVDSSHNKKNIKALQDAYPDMRFRTTLEYLTAMLGDFLESIDDVIRLLYIIVGGVVFLITVLLVKMLVTKEIPEVAMLKSIGYKNRKIKLWQLSRIIIILILGTIMGTIFANTVGNYLISLIFKVAGTANVMIYKKVLQVYVIIPVTLFIITTIAAICSLGAIKRTKIWEINNQE